MARHSSATTRDGKSDNNDSSLKSHSIDASLKRRARLLITNSSIPKQTRSLIRYALEINDPHLAQVVGRVESGEMTIECLEPRIKLGPKTPQALALWCLRRDYSTGNEASHRPLNLRYEKRSDRMQPLKIRVSRV